jgi:hypothetical protein
MLTYHNVFLDVDFAAIENLAPFLHLDIHTLETQILATLLEGIEGEHLLY